MHLIYLLLLYIYGNAFVCLFVNRVNLFKVGHALALVWYEIYLDFQKTGTPGLADLLRRQKQILHCSNCKGICNECLLLSLR